MATNERWTGWIGFAGLLLVIIAMVDFFEGLIAIIRGRVLRDHPEPDRRLRPEDLGVDHR